MSKDTTFSTTKCKIDCDGYTIKFISLVVLVKVS